jgi:DNA-binding transcriptional LysR family regulator
MDFTFRQLEIFRAVVVAGSITKASHRIGLSQPSISQQLAKMEESLGVQLINRNRTGTVSLTPAGEYWYRSSIEVMDRMQALLQEHDQTFRSANLVLKFGVTPALRGRFISGVARIALQLSNFTRFEMIYDLNSSLLVEKLRMHHINYAVVAEQALVDEASSFATAPLFDDKIVWAVPGEVSDEEIRHALQPGVPPAEIHPQLRHYVEIDSSVPTRQSSNEWYFGHLPYAVPTFRAPTFAASIEFAADGLATCHVLRSLIPNLSQNVLQSVKLFEIESQDRRVVLAMRKHLLSHPTFARFFQQIVDYCRTDYGPAMQSQVIRPLSDVLPAEPVSAASAQIHRLRV